MKMKKQLSNRLSNGLSNELSKDYINITVDDLEKSLIKIYDETMSNYEKYLHWCAWRLFSDKK